MRRGLDRVCDWGETLSGGEKQRVAMARLFYHRCVRACVRTCVHAMHAHLTGTAPQAKASLSYHRRIPSLVHPPLIFHPSIHTHAYTKHTNVRALLRPQFAILDECTSAVSSDVEVSEKEGGC